MKEAIYETESGPIHYWISRQAADQGLALVFLPGLTADHRLFDKQIAFFQGRYSVFVWDAPGHGASWPFQLNFHLLDEARWLDEILTAQAIAKPVIVGQSMGGYVGQAYGELYPDKLQGFISIDSAPLQREYITGIELFLLKRMEPIYRLTPWRLLCRWGVKGVATSAYGRALMQAMMQQYQGDQQRYSQLSGHGFKILAEAMEADLPYKLSCPALLICGKKDRAGSCIRYNKAWHKKTGIPLCWVEHAGHNANTDAPETVNGLINSFMESIR